VAEPGEVVPTPIDVVLADDHAMVRAGLRMVLETAPDIRVVGEAGDVDGALAVVREHQPRVVVLDLRMPGTQTIPAIPSFLEAAPGTAVLVLTMDDEPTRAREAIAVGASGYVLKDAADGELVQAIRAAAAGSTYLNPQLGAQLAKLPTTVAGDELVPGSTFAGHRIDALVARGGMAVVYRATDLALDRAVALKLVAPTLAADPVFRERFESECRLAAAIDHPNVVPVHRAGSEAGRLYLTMRYVDGTDLRTLLEREGKLEPTRAVRIAAQVARGLEAAHRHGLVHRDVKPGNVLIGRRDDEEQAYLTDFGISMDRSRAKHLTKTGFAVGTADYMAPEQARGAEIDGRADVYALGCVLFRALTGGNPYERGSELDTLLAHINDPPPRLRDVAPELPAELDALIARALSKRPEERHPSAAAFAREALAAVPRAPG
jgi:DNA-binding NarL/FixJ family response regulator